VPGVRIAGNWFKDAGFNYGDRVVLVAEDGKITIEREEKRDDST